MDDENGNHQENDLEKQEQVERTETDHVDSPVAEFKHLCHENSRTIDRDIEIASLMLNEADQDYEVIESSAEINIDSINQLIKQAKKRLNDGEIADSSECYDAIRLLKMKLADINATIGYSMEKTDDVFEQLEISIEGSSQNQKDLKLENKRNLFGCLGGS